MSDHYGTLDRSHGYLFQGDRTHTHDENVLASMLFFCYSPKNQAPNWTHSLAAQYSLFPISKYKTLATDGIRFPYLEHRLHFEKGRSMVAAFRFLSSTGLTSAQVQMHKRSLETIHLYSSQIFLLVYDYVMKVQHEVQHLASKMKDHLMMGQQINTIKKVFNELTSIYQPLWKEVLAYSGMVTPVRGIQPSMGIYGTLLTEDDMPVGKTYISAYVFPAFIEELPEHVYEELCARCAEHSLRGRP